MKKIFLFTAISSIVGAIIYALTHRKVYANMPMRF